MTEPQQLRPATKWYDIWLGKMDMKLMCLQNNRGEYLIDKLDERILNYLNRNCLSYVWRNTLLIIALINVSNNNDVKTILNNIQTLHPRFKDIFNECGITSFLNLDANVHLYKFFKGEICSSSTNHMKKEFFKRYTAVEYHSKKWILNNIPIDEQPYYKKFLLPFLNYDSKDFLFSKLALQQTEETRKNETDAIVPFLPKIRAEANLRWNQMKRIRDVFYRQIELVEIKKLSLPFEFSYEEPERIGEVFSFRLWDKSSFILQNKDEFSGSVINKAKDRTGPYSDVNNTYFLEFICAETVDNNSQANGLWFNELIKNNVVGSWDKNRSAEEHEDIKRFLNLWGYISKDNESPKPFASANKGVLNSSTFITRNQDKVNGILIDVEPIYTACTFALLAIDILTTTGARINELLQINNTKECITVKKLEDKLHFSFKAIPKGRDSLEEFYISKQTMENIQMVSRFLKESYKQDKIPSVLYRDARKHLFPEPKPFYFQYAGKSLTNVTIYSIIRFLLHGLIFETNDGNPVTIKTHLLRHAFATEAVQRQNLSIDIVAKMLHQKDLNITSYYSAPTPSQISQKIGEYHDVISSYVDIDNAYLRSPKELQQQFDDYAKQVGVYNKVLGGTCVTDYVCPTKMQCLGCKAKIPEPDQEDELLNVIQLSNDMEKRFKQMGLEIEARKAKEMAKQARIELKEIDLIKRYREERQYEPKAKINPFR